MAIPHLIQFIIIIWSRDTLLAILIIFRGSQDKLSVARITRQSEMADLARRATRWVGTFPYILTPIPNLYDHSFPRYGQITFLTFRRPTTLTFDLKFWKYLSVTVYPYVICMPSFIMIGWEMAEILHIEILRKHGQTHTQTDRQTDRHGHYNTSPSPYGGRGNNLSVLILNLLKIRDVIIFNFMTLHSYHNTCRNIWKITGQFTQVKCPASKVCQWIFSNSFHQLT